jgi:hypothetical protein
MLLTWLVFKVIIEGLCWLCERSNVARSIVQVVGTLCMISIAKEIFDRKDRP